MAIANIDPEKKELQFARENRPLFLIRKNDDYELFVIKGDMQPVGVGRGAIELTNHLLKIKQRDSLYLFSDCFTDQYGGGNVKNSKLVILRNCS